MSELTTEPTKAECPHCKGTGKVVVPPEVSTIEAYFFGCGEESGHYWFCSKNRSKLAREIKLSVGINIYSKIDTGFCPGVSDKIPDYRRTRPERVGEAALHHVDGWTILAFWDRSVDSRPGSHSTFVALGKHDYPTMIYIAKAQFPHVMKRQKVEIKLVESNT